MDGAFDVADHERVALEPTLALDIGGTKIAVALVRGAVVLAKDLAATPATDGPEGVIAAVVASVRGLLANHVARPTVVGAACAGVVTDGHVTALSMDLMPGWFEFPLVERLEMAFGVPAVALNDAQAAAYGESLYGAGRERDSSLFVTVSTGVGGGLVLAGRLWTGATGLAGHVGHVRDGVLERVASGTALARRAADLGHTVGAREVLAAADDGAAWAMGLLHDAVRELREALLDVKRVVDPELVVLGGSVGMNPVFLRALIAEAASMAAHDTIEIRAAELGADAGLVGVAAWARAGVPSRRDANAPRRGPDH